MEVGLPSRSSDTLFGHPRGLTVLFLTQMWAEFSFFGLQAMLVYYMTQQLGLSQAKSSLAYGAYGAAAFFSPFFGGMIADRWLGRTRSVVLGGILMMLGHFAMAFAPLLFPALVLVAAGNGLFLPPLAVQVSHLYADDDPRKATAFSAYYMGSNLGGFLAPLICGSLGELLGWHWGFAAAGIGMLIGLIIYRAGRRLLPPEPARPAGSHMATDAKLTRMDRQNLRTLFVVVAAVILFRIGYEQSGNVVALWIENQTDRSVSLFGHRTEVPATWFQAVNSLLIIGLTPLLMKFWRRPAAHPDNRTLLRRMSLGCVVASLGMIVMVAAAAVQSATAGQVGMGWVMAYLILLTLGELLVIPFGLTLVGTLSPVQMAGMAMGAWYIAKFIGSLLAGILGAFWESIPATSFFAIGAAAVLAGAGVLYLLSVWAGEPSEADAGNMLAPST
ncbi:peptide MFS transporter [Sphingomonas sp. BK580]|uniref:peptide MFS transporter n=1 Tax=Sphingomonas sp. BK580 TaxID=2586972 RepID=UPI00161F7881